MLQQQKIKVLITGASGFIGSHLVEEALNRNWTVYAGVRKTSSRRYLQDKRIQYFNIDLDNSDALHDDLSAFGRENGGFDYIVHNAGVTKPHHPGEFVSGNAEFTRHFAKMALETQPALRKFVFMGSIAALGPGDISMADAISETKPPRPITPYGKSKLLAEEYLESIAGLPFVIIRPAAVYGPRDEKFILRVIKMLEKGFEVRLGPSDQASSFVHVVDLARVVLDACEVKHSRTSYMIAEGTAYGQEKFNAYLKDSLGVKTVALRIPASVLVAMGFTMFHAMRLFGKQVHLSHDKMREITAKNWQVDISKAVRELGYQPEYELRKGIEHTVQWYRNRGNSYP